MKGQIGSIDAAISLSVLTAMVIMWAHMYQDASPIFQIYTYRQTALYAEHMANKLLYDISAPWICTTGPNGYPIPACVQSGSSIDAKTDLDKDDLNVNCNLSCTAPGLPVSNCSDTYPSTDPRPPRYVLNFRACVGDWNSCTWVDCNLEVWHR